MAHAPLLTDLLDSPPSPIAPANGHGQRPVRTHAVQAAANPFRRRLDRVTLGFLLGGLCLGTAGFILGAGMGHRHPVAVTLSVLWWSIYCGCFGASVGALFGLWTDRTPASPSHGSDGAAKPANGADGSALPAGYGDSLSGANRGRRKRAYNVK
jgi:hypothetical protein